MRHSAFRYGMVSAAALACAQPVFPVGVFIDPVGTATIQDFEAISNNSLTLNALGVDPSGVIQIRVTDSVTGLPGQNIFGEEAASGFLLSDLRHVVTVAHVLDTGGGVNDPDISDYTIRLQNRQGVVSALPQVNVNGDLTGNPGLNTITVHPLYVEADDAIPGAGGISSFSAFAGYDVAVIDLGQPVTADVGGYDIDSTGLIGFNFVGIGYGPAGDQTNPGSVNQNSFDRYFFRNFVAGPPPQIKFLLNATSREDTQAIFDFDGPGVDPLGDGANIFAEGVNVPGDSGGPLLIADATAERAAGGILSWRSATPADPNPNVAGNVGEFGVATDFSASNGEVDDPLTAEDESQRTIGDWINDVAGIKVARGTNPNGGSFNDPTAFAFNNAPQAGSNVSLNGNTSNPSGATYTPGAGASNFSKLTVGGGEGVKTFAVTQNQSVTLSGAVAATTNGRIRLEQGGIQADQLFVNAVVPVLSGPTPVRGEFRWTDINALGSTSIDFNQVNVGPGGDYIDDWFDDATGTGNVAQLDVAAGGRAFFQWTADGYGDVTNAGIVSVGETVVGNQLQVDSYTQNESGALALYVGSNGGNDFSDAVVATGTIDLAGGLVVFNPGVYEFGDYFVLMNAAGGVAGTFDTINIDGLIASLNADVIYRATEVVLSINAALAGDYNNNGVVDGADYTVWADNFGSLTNLTADGNGNGVVDAADYSVWQDNFGMTSSLLAANVPEPGTAAVVIATLPALLTRRRDAA